MSLLSELSEDMRLARLNNPSYGFLFKLIDVVSILFKVTVLVAFCLGIWHITYRLGEPDYEASAPQNNSSAPLAKGAVSASLEADPAVESLSPERVEMLRQFAVDNRVPGADKMSEIEARSFPTLADSRGPMIAKVATPQPIVDRNSSPRPVKSTPEMIVAGDLVPLPVDANLPDVLDTLTLDSKGIFDVLENKMQAALGADKDPVIDSPAVTPLPASVVPVLANDDDGAKDAAWILAQSPEHYTIQIGSTTNRPFLVTFAQQLPKDEPTAIYHYVFRDRPEYGLSYGVFDSVEAANVALEGLTQSARRYGAFSRKLSIVHQQIKKP